MAETGGVGRIGIVGGRAPEKITARKPLRKGTQSCTECKWTTSRSIRLIRFRCTHLSLQVVVAKYVVFSQPTIQINASLALLVGVNALTNEP